MISKRAKKGVPALLEGQGAIIWCLAALALLLRAYGLAEFPRGLMGDEATSGLEARRILADGWIGPYSPFAAGQPSGVLYVSAGAIALLGDNIFSLRFVSALAGVGSVVVAYVFVRRQAGTAVAVTVALLICVLGWHIHFSRFAVPVSVWPLIVVTLIGALSRSLETGKTGWWIATGGITAAGLYVYFAHAVVLIIIALYLVFLLFRRRDQLLASKRGPAVGFVAFLIVSIPMTQFALTESEALLSHPGTASLTELPEWEAESTLLGKGKFLVGRYVEYWDHLCCHPEVDGVDGTGLTPLFPWPLLLAAAIGVPLAFRKSPFFQLTALTTLLLPIAFVVTDGALARRTLPLTVLLPVLVGLATVEFVRNMVGRRALLSWTAAACATIVVFLGAVSSTYDYFGRFLGSSEEQGVFGWALTDAARYMARLESGDYVYFLSEGSSLTHETVRYVAPDVSGEDRSAEFGHYSLDADPTKGRPVFVLLGVYRDDVVDLQEIYPGGQVVRHGNPDTEFVVYLPPT